MNRSASAWSGLSAALAILVVGSSACWSQTETTVNLAPSGLLELSQGDVSLGTIELNAHGAKWTHAPQKDAKATASALPESPGKRLTGTLPVPNTDGGSIGFVETVEVLSQGIHLDYDLTMSKEMKLNGLQFSLNLPVATYAGKEVFVSELHAEPKLVGLPKEQQESKFQLWSGQGAKIEIAKDTLQAVTIELRASTDVVIHDLRQWEHPIFEIRFPAIMQDPGRPVKAGEKFHLDLTVTFANPVRLQAP
jgi:hypothetical protein